MDTRSWGVFFVVLGLIQVVLAGIFLRWNQGGKRSSGGVGKTSGERWWIWIGRFGTACSIAGVFIILVKA